MNRDQRRLAAIVSMDVAGYSRLMGRDESGTLASLETPQRESVDPKIIVVHLVKVAGNVRHASGRDAESNSALQQLGTAYRDEAAYQIAQVYAARGDADRTFEWLDRAHQQQDPGLNDLMTEPLFRFLHSNPSWNTLLRKIGLPSRDS